MHDLLLSSMMALFLAILLAAFHLIVGEIDIESASA